jgi:uncharacterized membrane protein YphA (DoxX/SURF4 family)
MSSAPASSAGGFAPLGPIAAPSSASSASSAGGFAPLDTAAVPPSAPGGVIAPAPEPAAAEPTVDLAQARSDRAQALGQLAPTPDVVAAPVKLGPPTQYNKYPSLVFLVLRLAVAALMGIRCFRDAEALSATTQIWRDTVLGGFVNAEVLTWIQIAAEGTVALLLLFGLGTRVVGGVLVVLGAAWLTFILWGAVSPFQRGIPGFTGEFEVLLVAVGFLFTGLGGGGWLSLDAFFHRARLERKNAKTA